MGTWLPGEPSLHELGAYTPALKLHLPSSPVNGFSRRKPVDAKRIGTIVPGTIVLVVVCLIGHELDRGHGDECASCTPCRQNDARGTGRSRRAKRPLSGLHRTRRSFGHYHGTGTAGPGTGRRSVRIDPAQATQTSPPLIRCRSAGTGQICSAWRMTECRYVRGESAQASLEILEVIVAGKADGKRIVRGYRRDAPP